MARITIDDCTDKIENRFDLVLFSAHRARLLLEGVTLGVNNSNSEKFEKKTVHALREISEEIITPSQLEESLIGKMQTEKRPKELTDDAVEAENSREGLSENFPNDQIYQATLEEPDRKIKKNTLNSKETIPDDEATFDFSDNDVVEDEE